MSINTAKNTDVGYKSTLQKRKFWQGSRNTNAISGNVAPAVPDGGGSATSTRIGVSLPSGPRSRPVSVSTAAGEPAVQLPPTLVTPPNAVAAVRQQLATSTQLAENTVTGKGTGAGRSSSPVSKRVMGVPAYGMLAALGVVLLLAFAVDRGKL